MEQTEQEPLRVIISLDVEEEGLFSGQYRRTGCTVTNVQHLTDLARLSDELGFPLTLFCSWAVLTDTAACRTLEIMRDRHGSEIGCHLHHWSTPPFTRESGISREPERTDTLAPELFTARMESLLNAARAFQGAPVESFRMGRWDLKAKLFPILADLGIRADSSVCPLRSFRNGADHFLAPDTPYWALGKSVPFLEVPVTQIPLLPMLAQGWYRAGAGKPWLDRFHFLAALSPNPFWHAQPFMRASARLLHLRKGPVLSLFWHSTEIAPGCSPHVPDKASAQRMLEKIFSFCTWLRNTMPVRGMTLGELFRESRSTAVSGTPGPVYPERSSWAPGGDW